MKFTKLIAASFAVLTLFSCTRELMDAGQLNYAPGDAVLVLNLSKPTTYSTTLNETAIVGTPGAKVYREDGTEITPTSVDLAGGRISIVIAAADYVAGDKVDVYLYANGTPVTVGATGDDHKASTVGTTIDRELTAGAPAGYYETVTLVAGTTPLAQLPTTNSKSQLKRAIARVDVVNGSKWYTDETYATLHTDQSGAQGFQIPIVNYKVDFTKVNLSSGLMYGGMTNATSAVEGAGTASHTITGVVTGMYKSRETLAYMYPSANVVARVSVPPTVTGANTPSPITFSPAANKNYTIKITPFKTTDGSITTDWEIDPGYDEDVDLGGVNFNDDVATTEFLDVKIPGAGITNNRVALNAMTSVNNHDISLVDFAFDKDGSATTDADWTALDEVTSITVGNSPNSNYLSITANVADNKITVNASPNYTAGSFTIPVTVSGKIGTKEYTSTFDVVLSALTKEEREALDAGTVEMGANKFMMLGTTGNAYDDLQNYIRVKQAGGFNDETIMKNQYSVITEKDKSLFFSGGTIGKAYTDCPKGYKNPTIQEFCDGVFGGSARNYFGGGPGNWASIDGVPEYLQNSVILTKKYTASSGGFTYYTVERNGRIMYLFGSIGYMCNSSTWYDNTTTGITSGFKINVAPWSDGLSFVAANPAIAATAGSSRIYPCIVDKSYNGGLK